jgi:hypothetical protein
MSHEREDQDRVVATRRHAGPAGTLRGQFNLRIATRVQDPLTLTALALESGGEYVILASMDLCTVEVEALANARAALAERLPGFDPRRLVVNATHTHTGPFSGNLAGLQRDAEYVDLIRSRYPDYMSPSEYGVLLTERLVDAACEAWELRTDGYVGWGYSHAVVGENRRVRYMDDRATMYGSTSAADFSHIEGHVDHSVNLLCTYDADQALTGVLMNVPCPSQVSESGQDFVSADYWHDAREELRRRNGTGLFVLPQCSAAGDQSPHRLIGTRAEARMLELKYGAGDDGPLNSALRRDLARRLADALDDAEPAIRKDLRDEAVLKYEQRILELEHWDLSESEYTTLLEQIAEATRQLDELGDSDRLGGSYTSLRSRVAWCRRAADRYEHPLPSVPAEVTVLRLGDIAFVTAPFEYYLDHGDRIKGRSPALQTFVVQLAGPGTYLPTDRAARGLSYGAVPASCSVSPAGGQHIVDEAVAILESLFAAE